jgi:serine/threonine protein kinase
VTGVVGQGGFGIVYRAEDPATGAEVAIKEFLPAQLATRRADGGLEPASPGHAETFSAGLEGFLDEARLLARVRHPGLVEVLHGYPLDGVIFTTGCDKTTPAALMAAIPAGKVLVSESGITSADQIEELEQAGVDAVLVGERLMRAPDPAEALREHEAAQRAREAATGSAGASSS